MPEFDIKFNTYSSSMISRSGKGSSSPKLIISHPKLPVRSNPGVKNVWLDWILLISPSGDDIGASILFVNGAVSGMLTNSCGAATLVPFPWLLWEGFTSCVFSKVSTWAGESTALALKQYRKRIGRYGHLSHT